MPHTTIKDRKLLRGQENTLKQAKKRSGYIPVAKHSQKKEQPNTFVVGIRLPYGYFAAYKKLSLKDRNALKMHIQSFLNASTE